jgi:aminoglycoside phosphotransferase (APT) family kinase protein
VAGTGRRVRRRLAHGIAHRAGRGYRADPVDAQDCRGRPRRCGCHRHGGLAIDVDDMVQVPRPWSVYRWIEGEPACQGPIADLPAFAADLAGFLAALYAIDVAGGPAPGVHSAFRGGPLTTWDEQTRRSIRLLADDIDAQAVTRVWEASVASSWEGPPVWVHGDVTASNLLVADGTLHAVIDFGCAAVGDPACDLVMAWTFFTGDSAAVFRRAPPFDDTTWARGRGWALWKALITLAIDREGGDDAQAAARRFGWRHSPGQIINRVVADHARAAWP